MLFPGFGTTGFYSVGVLSQRSAGGFWCEIVSSPDFSIADSDATFDIGGGGNVSQKWIR